MHRLEKNILHHAKKQREQRNFKPLNLNKLKLSIDNESVDIYIDKAQGKEKLQVFYWHIEEWEEDSSVAITVFKAINLFYTDKQKLLKLSSLI